MSLILEDQTGLSPETPSKGGSTMRQSKNVVLSLPDSSAKPNATATTPPNIKTLALKISTPLQLGTTTGVCTFGPYMHAIEKLINTHRCSDAFRTAPKEHELNSIHTTSL
jgi:hypothetical protein